MGWHTFSGDLDSYIWKNLSSLATALEPAETGTLRGLAFRVSQAFESSHELHCGFVFKDSRLGSRI